MSNTDMHPEVFFCECWTNLGCIWGAFGVICWVQNASKNYVFFLMHFACCLARGLEAPRREVPGGVGGNLWEIGLRGRIQEGEAKQLGT